MPESFTLNKESLRRKNFAPEEFFNSFHASKNNISNDTDNLNILTSLALLADKIQEVRDLLGLPIKITSAYRCLELNRALGSKDTSQHISGQAVDFQCKGFGSPQEIVKLLRKIKIEVDQCLVEKSGTKEWVHLSIKHNKNRNQFGEIVNGEFRLFLDFPPQ